MPLLTMLLRPLPIFHGERGDRANHALSHLSQSSPNKSLTASRRANFLGSVLMWGRRIRYLLPARLSEPFRETEPGKHAKVERLLIGSSPFLRAYKVTGRTAMKFFSNGA